MSVSDSVILSRGDGEGSRRFSADVRRSLGTTRADGMKHVVALARRDPSPSSRLRMTRGENANV